MATATCEGPAVVLDCARRKHHAAEAVAAAVLLATQLGMSIFALRIHSPTLNEPAHLAAGLSHLQFGRFDVYSVNPPLARIVAVAPVVFGAPRLDWRGFLGTPGARTEFTLGEDFVAANGNRSALLITVARWACIPFSLLGGYLAYGWARQLYGDVAGLVTLALWCFCPNVLGHGWLITPDVPATALSLAACYSFWHWLRKPTWPRALISGAILGIAELTKMTLVILFPLWIVMWLVYQFQGRPAILSRGGDASSEC